MRDKRSKKGRKELLRVNHQIRVAEIRLSGEDGEQFGVVPIDEARTIAADRGLDLVEVSPNAVPPVVKLIDYGKYKYQQQKKANETKKKQIQVHLKEIQFRPNIEQHDLETKLKRAEKFLMQSDKVKMVMQFRGREMANREIGVAKFNLIIEQVKEFGAIVESAPKQMGNRIITILAPDKLALAKKMAN
ncbi:MAG: translation initiation factor IF-3 [Bdellovibrionales bacterium]|nr:translation initiation factor IF-3 [Bdellovibrionales bacterium]MBT3525014.1 translation initiation factor IF-3 [Bdellovibrionales bacterium]MBT7669424.1 translation initiation factor IF-3 [Bdellovibrionales bacterium]MBT7765887.1 translation initiation factor IF-3 [Bdellovibrionales bacterium]